MGPSSEGLASFLQQDMMLPELPWIVCSLSISVGEFLDAIKKGKVNVWTVVCGPTLKGLASLPLSAWACLEAADLRIVTQSHILNYLPYVLCHGSRGVLVGPYRWGWPGWCVEGPIVTMASA